MKQDSFTKCDPIVFEIVVSENLLCYINSLNCTFHFQTRTILTVAAIQKMKKNAYK